MKKSAIFLFFIFSFVHLQAMPAGSPFAPRLIEEGFFSSTASWVSLRCGYEGDVVLDSRLRKNAGNVKRIDNFKQDTNSGTITLNLQDRFDIYGAFGVTYIRSDWRVHEPCEVISRIETETEGSFSWSFGSKAVLYEWGKSALGLGGRYGKTKAPVLWLTKDGNSNFADQAHFCLRDWHVDLSVSYQILPFVPYIGAKYSSQKVTLEDFHCLPISDCGTSLISLENRNSVGMILGCSLSTRNMFMLNVEGRFFDEKAFTVSGEFRF